MNVPQTLIILESTENGTDRKFFSELLKKIFGDNYTKEKNIEFKHGDESGGIEDIKKLLKIGLRKITAKNVLIIVDADEDADKRFKEVQEALKSRNDKGENFNLPKKLGEINKEDRSKIDVGVFLLPNNKDKGSLETLLVKALNHPQKEDKNQCIEEYFKCLKRKKDIDKISEITENNKSKATYRIFRATPKPDDTYTDVAQYIDFDSQELNPLISFIKEVVNL